MHYRADLRVSKGNSYIRNTCTLVKCQKICRSLVTLSADMLLAELCVKDNIVKYLLHELAIGVKGSYAH